MLYDSAITLPIPTPTCDVGCTDRIYLYFFFTEWIYLIKSDFIKKLFVRDCPNESTLTTTQFSLSSCNHSISIAALSKNETVLKVVTKSKN